MVPPFCSCKWSICFMFYIIGGLKKTQKTVIFMEDGAVDTTVIAGGQHNMGWMADFSPFLASSVFDL